MRSKQKTVQDIRRRDWSSDVCSSDLDEPFPASFNAIVFELKGDVLILKGKMAQAKSAYQQAMAASQTPSRWLQYKIDDIGMTDKPATTDNSEPSA